MCVRSPSFQAISDSAASYGRSEPHRLPFLRVDEWITKKELKLGSCTNQGRTQRDVDVRDKVRKQFCKLYVGDVIDVTNLIQTKGSMLARQGSAG